MRTVALNMYVYGSVYHVFKMQSNSMQLYASLDLNDLWKGSVMWVLRWEDLLAGCIVGEMFDRFKIVKCIIFYLESFTNGFLLNISSTEEPAIFVALNYIWAKKIFLTCYFRKPCII